LADGSNHRGRHRSATRAIFTDLIAASRNVDLRHGEGCLMHTEKKVIELLDLIVTLIVRPKKPPKPDNDNVPYDHWSEELKELLDDYD
jgi:hypothetical protein